MKKRDCLDPFWSTIFFAVVANVQLQFLKDSGKPSPTLILLDRKVGVRSVLYHSFLVSQPFIRIDTHPIISHSFPRFLFSFLVLIISPFLGMIQSFLIVPPNFSFLLLDFLLWSSSASFPPCPQPPSY